MKLAVISNVAGCSWAGSEELWLETARKALKTGWSVTACLHPDLHQADPLLEFRSSGGRVVGWQRGSIARLRLFQEKFYPQFTTARLGCPDLILVSAGSLPALAYVPGLVPFLESTNVPFILLCQFNSDALQFSSGEREKVRSLIARASWSVFVSKDNRDIAKRQFALPISASSVICNPIRVHRSSPLSPRASFDDVEVVFGSVARLESCWKGQDLLLEILGGDAWLKKSWILRLFGEGPDLDHLKRLVIMYGLTDRVRFEGYNRDLNDIWSSTDILLMPSRGEGTPLALLEAMMCGRPAVATRVGGIPEVLICGLNGFLADAPSPLSFGAALVEAWKARNRWHEMGLSAHQAAQVIAQRDPASELLQVITNIGKSGGTRGAS